MADWRGEGAGREGEKDEKVVKGRSLNFPFSER